MRKTYHVWWPDTDKGPEDGLEMEADDLKEAVVRAAEEDFDSRDGWERKYPLKVEVQDPTGVRWVVELEQEQVPVFFVAACRVAEAT